MAVTDISEKTFLFGVGAQKAGTTWLHRYLQAHPEVYMSPIKEMHFFTEMFLPGGNRQMARTMHYTRLGNIVRRLSEGKNVPADKVAIAHDLLDRAAMRGVPEAYFDYFARRMAPEQGIFGEITPAYSTLKEEHFRQIATYHPDIRPIFIMRDPVARFWSAMRMGEREDSNFSAVEQIVPQLENRAHLERGRYDLTLEALRQVFGDRVIVLFYETFFTQDTIDGLCSALDITPRPADFWARENVSPEPVPLSEENGARIFEVFAPVYTYLEAAGYRLPEAWQISRDRYGRA